MLLIIKDFIMIQNWLCSNHLCEFWRENLMNITSLHTHILEASTAPVKWCRGGGTECAGCAAAHPLFPASFDKDHSFFKKIYEHY